MAKLLDYDFRHYGCERKIIVVPESIGMGESYYINEPFYGANAASRTQTIYMGTAINYAPCSIYGFSIYFSKKPHSTGYTFENFTIRMKHTSEMSYSEDSLATFYFDNDDLETVYSGSLTINSTGDIYIEFDTPFEYDGDSNLMIDMYYYFSSGGAASCDTGGEVLGITGQSYKCLEKTETSGVYDPEEWTDADTANRPYIQLSFYTNYHDATMANAYIWESGGSHGDWCDWDPILPARVDRNIVKGYLEAGDDSTDNDGVTINEWMCFTTPVTIPSDRYSPTLILVGNSNVPVGCSFGVYATTGSTTPSDEEYELVKDLTNVPMQHSADRFIVNNNYDGCVFVDFSAYKGQTINIALAIKKENSSTYYIPHVYIYELYLLTITNRTYMRFTDLLYAYSLRKKLFSKECAFRYNLHEYRIEDLNYAYDLTSSQTRLTPNLMFKYHLMEDTTDEVKPVLIVDNTLRVKFELLSLKKPSVVIVGGYLDIQSINITQNAGDYCCAVTFETNTYDFWENVYRPYIDIAGKDQRYYVKLTIDEDEECNLLLEDCSANYTMEEHTWTFNGRTLQCLLDKPYGFFYKYVRPKVSTGMIELSAYIRSVWNHAKNFVHYPRNLVIRNIPKNYIPESQLEVDEKSYIDVITELCNEFELNMIPQLNGDMYIYRKYEWIGVREPVSFAKHPSTYPSAISPGFPPAVHTITNVSPVEVISLEESAREWLNRIKIVGEKDKDANSLSISVKEMDPAQATYPGNDIVLEVYSPHSQVARLWCNLGLFTESMSMSSKVELGTKYIIDEEGRSIDKKSFTVQYPFAGVVERKIVGMTVYCIDSLRSYSIDSYDPKEQKFTIKGEFPYEDSYLRISYFAKNFGDITWRSPAYETKDCIIRGQCVGAEADCRVEVNWSSVSMSIYLENNEVPAQKGKFIKGRIYTNVKEVIPSLFTMFAEKGFIHGKSVTFHLATDDPGVPEEELADEETEWRPTEEDIEDSGFETQIRFTYKPPDYESEFINETLEAPQEDTITGMYGDAEVTTDISLTEPEDWDNIALSAIVDGDITVRLTGSGESGTGYGGYTVPVYLAATHPYNYWGGIKVIICQDAPSNSSNNESGGTGGGGSGYDINVSDENFGDYTRGGVNYGDYTPQVPEGYEDPNINLNYNESGGTGGGGSATLIPINEIPIRGDNNSVSQNSGSTWDKENKVLRCGSGQSEDEGFRYYYRVECPIPSTGNGKNYPVSCQVHFHHIKNGESVANATATVTSNLPEINMSVVVDPEFVDMQEYYAIAEPLTSDGEPPDEGVAPGSYIIYKYKRITQNIYVVFDTKPAPMPSSKLCIGQWNTSNEDIRHNFGELSSGTASSLPTTLTSDDSQFNADFNGTSILCSGNVEADNSSHKTVYKYTITYGSGREYLVAFGIYYKGHCIASGTNTFNDSVEVLSNGNPTEETIEI